MSDESREGLGRFVGLEKPSTLQVRALQSAEMSATRLRWNGSDDGNPTRLERNDGYLVCLQRRDLPSHPYWVDGRPVPLATVHRGQFLLLDLNVEHASLVRTAVDCVSMYMSRAAIDRFQEEHDLLPLQSLRTALGAPFDDRVVRSLGESLLSAIDAPAAASRLFVDHVALALLSHMTAAYGGLAIAVPPKRGRLAPWQERRAKEMLLASIDGGIGLEELAGGCGLSRSHFARAFKATTGASPLQWLLARRIDRAKNLLLNSALPLDQVADQCGFADQSHFSRTFVRLVNATPGRWRRLRSL
jgi:AraC-like DNA-binding protein